jgi:hypothetical protein
MNTPKWVMEIANIVPDFIAVTYYPEIGKVALYLYEYQIMGFTRTTRMSDENIKKWCILNKKQLDKKKPRQYNILESPCAIVKMPYGEILMYPKTEIGYVVNARLREEANGKGTDQ